MNDKDFKKMGFKCGLEIHQQLNSKAKLFCHCPTGYRNDKPDAEIVRHMRPTLSELGEYDGTALMEFKTKKQVIYQLYRDNMCTYEMDDTPPFLINKEALDIAIKLGLMLNCAIVDELHVSRKQYLDGSIPTGFQRTAVVGVGGWIPYKDRRINISHICLEEDACREVSDRGHTIIFKTDRLSMPLLEVITEPDMLTPREAREVNEIIGRMLKASGLVRRGIGSVRQDVNVSIEGSTRVEMKGISKTKYVERMTGIEAMRQRHLLDIRDELQARGINKSDFKPETLDATELLSNETSTVVVNAVKFGLMLGAVKLPGFAGLLKREIQPGRTMADEFAGRVMVIACLNNLPNIAVSDINSPDLGINAWNKLKTGLEATDKDVVILVWGMEPDVQTAFDEIIIRANEAFDGVPNDTRQHLKDMTTGFERVLPGPDRMYPDTDSPPVRITAEKIDQLRQQLPPLSWEIERRWREIGVDEKVCARAVVSPFASLYDKIISDNNIKPNMVYALLKSTYKSNRGIVAFDPHTCLEIFKAFQDKNISRADVKTLLKTSDPHNLKLNFDKLVKSRIKPDDAQLAKIIDDELGKVGDVTFSSRKNKFDYIVGRVKSRFDNVSNGSLIAYLLAEKLVV